MKSKSAKTKVEINTSLALLPMASIVKAVKVHLKTLLIYEEEGIVKPLKKENERRYCSLDDLEKNKTNKRFG